MLQLRRDVGYVLSEEAISKRMQQFEEEARKLGTKAVQVSGCTGWAYDSRTIIRWCRYQAVPAELMIIGL